jgi:transporter family-2 protein
MLQSGIIGLMLAAMVAGFGIPTQTGINTQLGKAIGSPFMASLISFCVGTTSILLVVLLSQTPFPSAEKLSTVPWWGWYGGIFGALFVTVAVLLAPRLGATTMVALMIGGQMLASLFFDHYGFFGFPQHSLSWLRFLGAMLVFAGVLFIQRF